MNVDLQRISRIVRLALEEDIGTGDVTTELTLPRDSEVDGEIVAKEEGIIAGLEVAREVYRQVDSRIQLTALVEDGRLVQPGEGLALVSGPARGILTGERTVLNFMQRLSGIATLTHRYVQAVVGTGAVILDTRKTTPGLRVLEKYAVRMGGGSNHREGLYDMVLIKDNHLQVVGDLKEAIVRGKRGRGDMLVEVEVRTMKEVREAVETGVDRIMLDNMDVAEMKEAVSYIRRTAIGTRNIEVEASGGIDLANLRQVAETGVDFISVGAITHSSRALDIAFYLK